MQFTERQSAVLLGLIAGRDPLNIARAQNWNVSSVLGDIHTWVHTRGCGSYDILMVRFLASHSGLVSVEWTDAAKRCLSHLYPGDAQKVKRGARAVLEDGTDLKRIELAIGIPPGSFNRFMASWGDMMGAPRDPTYGHLVLTQGYAAMYRQSQSAAA